MGPQKYSREREEEEESVNVYPCIGTSKERERERESCRSTWIFIFLRFWFHWLGVRLGTGSFSSSYAAGLHCHTIGVGTSFAERKREIKGENSLVADRTSWIRDSYRTVPCSVSAMYWLGLRESSPYFVDEQNRRNTRYAMHL